MLAQQATARKKFQGYKREKPMTAKEPKVDRTVEKITDAWEKAHETWYLVNHQHTHDYYERVCPLVEGLGHSAMHVESFVSFFRILKNDRDTTYEFGIETFLSALINSSEDNGFTLDLGCLMNIIGMGERNRKNVTITCNVGLDIGHKMESGLLHIVGDCRDGVGRKMSGGKIIVDGCSMRGTGDDENAMGMKGGTVVIKKSCQNSVGGYMKGGRIIIHGELMATTRMVIDAGSWMEGGEIHILGKTDAIIGHGMSGGEIHLYDDFNEIGDVHKGKIYHKGKLIVDR